MRESARKGLKGIKKAILKAGQLLIAAATVVIVLDSEQIHGLPASIRVILAMMLCAMFVIVFARVFLNRGLGKEVENEQ